jgi:hypothetical protein
MYKFTKHNPSKLELQAKPHPFTTIFLLVWSIGFGGIPLAVIIIFAPDVGMTRLLCYRTESAQIECAKSRTRYFGLISDSPELVKSVTQAQLNTKEILESDGDRMVKNSLILGTINEEVKIFENLYNKALGENGEAKKLNAIASQLQRFINSPSPSITVVIDDNFDQGIAAVLFFGFFTLLALVVLDFALRSQTVILNKTSRRYTHKTHTFLGTVTHEHDLAEIKNIEIQYNNDSDGMRFAVISIVLRSGKAYKLRSSYRISNSVQTSDRLKEFLGFSLNP